MDTKQAVQQAKEYVIDLFADEDIADVGLEEVKFDDSLNVWEITIGFTRPWNRRGLANLPFVERRSYKIIRISDADGQAISVVHRNTISAG